MVYEYQDTVITVRPGLGIDNWATCKLKKSGSWTMVKSPEMPKVNNMADAVNNLHTWAEKKKLRRADCGCCYFQCGEKCTKYGAKLRAVETIIYSKSHLRCKECDEFEKGR